jgi:hypothetical protein
MVGYLEYNYATLIFLDFYALKIYVVAGGSASSSIRGADRGRLTGTPGIGGARGRRARREPARVHGSAT